MPEQTVEKSNEQLAEENPPQQNEPLVQENINLKHIIQSNQQVIASQNTLIQALERVIKAHHIKDEAFRLLNEAYRSFNESNRLLNEAYRNWEAANHPMDKANQPMNESNHRLDEAHRYMDDAFRQLDEAFHRWNEATHARKDSTEERNTLPGHESAPSNQEKPINEQIIELSAKVKQSTKLGDDKHSERIVKRIAHALLLIKQKGRMRVNELRKQLGTNRSALQRDAARMMSQLWIIGEGGPINREYSITDAGIKLIEQQQG
ncbi:MAG: hypothetical protein HY960_11510 [Ignavibacteriae bacterium]|nr:hypothetical protein [Ignavibacteriota bacterium]